MIERFKNIKDKLDNNPQLKAKFQELKPQRTIWGFLGIIIFFFVPEIINILYYKEINRWVADSTNIYYSKELADKIIWITQKIFNGEISYINLGLGFALLWWLYSDSN
jgi:hypothetical protein